MAHDPDEKPVVLVVDDESLLRWHAADVLQDHGYAVIEAEDAASAMAIMEKRPDVRLLFTDVQMPGRHDGVELARTVHERWPHVLLLVTSADVTLSDKELPDSGRFVPKPYDDRDLVEHAKELIGSKSGPTSM